MSIEVIVALATALGIGGLLQTIWASFSQRRKVGADAAKEITAAAVELLAPLRQELALERAESKAAAAESSRLAAKARLDLDKVVAQLDVCKRMVAGLNADLEACRRRNRELEMTLGGSP